MLRPDWLHGLHIPVSIANRRSTARLHLAVAVNVEIGVCVC